MFAGFEAMQTLGVAVGGLLAPLVIDVLGVRLALVAIGVMAPLAVAASWPELRRLDARMRVRNADIEILRGVRMLGALPAATIEQLGAGSSMPSSRRGRRCSSRASTATASTSSSPAVPRSSATGASSTRSDAATASARSPC